MPVTMTVTSTRSVMNTSEIGRHNSGMSMIATTIIRANQYHRDVAAHKPRTPPVASDVTTSAVIRNSNVKFGMAIDSTRGRKVDRYRGIATEH